MPSSPVTSDHQPDPSTRRGFFRQISVWLAAVPLLGAAGVALRAALATRSGGRPARLPLARAADVPSDGILARTIAYRRRVGPALQSVTETVYLTRDADSRILALSGECTHLQCPVSLRKVEPGDDAAAPFVCKCHDGRFARTGEVVAGPPRAPLRRLPIAVPEDPQGIVELLGDA